MQENIQIYGWKRCIKLCLKRDSLCEVTGGGTLCGRGQPRSASLRAQLFVVLGRAADFSLSLLVPV